MFKGIFVSYFFINFFVRCFKEFFWDFNIVNVNNKLVIRIIKFLIGAIVGGNDFLFHTDHLTPFRGASYRECPKA